MIGSFFPSPSPWGSASHLENAFTPSIKPGQDGKLSHLNDIRPGTKPTDANIRNFILYHWPEVVLKKGKTIYLMIFARTSACGRSTMRST